MSDYLLGHHEKEWARLEDQHALWRDDILADLRAAGLGPGSRVLDVGCGIGSLLADLADVVGPTGRAVGVERDASAAELARRRFAGLGQVEVRYGDLLDGPLPTDFDLVVCRWVLSFLPDVDLAVRRLASCARPGGLVAVHDYDHDGVNVFPAVDGFAEVIEAFRAAYRDSGGDLWVATRLPRAFADAGLEVVALTPHVKASGPGGGAWRWVARFLTEHLDQVVASGHLDPAVATRFTEALAAAEADPHALLVSPMNFTVVGRRS